MSSALRDPATRRQWGLDQLSIRAKLGLASALVVLALVVIPLVSWYRDAAIRGMDDTRLEIAKLDHMVLALQRSQNDFINTFDAKHREDFSHTFEAFVENTESLKARFWDLGLPIDTLERLVVLTSEYQYQFEVMAFALTDIGQSDEEGWRRSLQNELLALDRTIGALPVSRIQSELHYHLAMARLPAQWLVSGRAKDAASEFIAHMDHIEIMARGAVKTTSDRDAIIVAVEKSLEAFARLNDAVVEVGLSYDEGVLGEISWTVQHSKTVVQDLNDQVNAAITARERRLSIAIGAMAAA